MPWEPGTLLGLRDTTNPFGKYLGVSLFVMLEHPEQQELVIVLTPICTRAAIPAIYLTLIQDVTPVPPGPTPSGGKG